MIIFDRDGSTTTSVCGEGLLVQHPTPTPTPTQQQIQEPINKNIIDIIKKSVKDYLILLLL